MKRLLLLLFLASCAVTPRARLRVKGQALLGQCLNAGGDVRDCLIKNAQWCRSVGLEASCGADEYWPKRPSPHPRAKVKK